MSSVSSAGSADLFSPDDEMRIEKWYPRIASHTFETEVLPLSFEECKALQAGYEANKTLQGLRGYSPADLDRLGLRPLVDKLSTPHELVARLRQRVADKLQQWPSDTGVFVKLSTRSPKDSSLTSDRMRGLISAMPPPIPGEYSADDDETNWQMAAMAHFTRCCSLALRVTDPEVAVDLLCQSARVYQDIHRLDLLYSAKQAFELNLILRKWEPRLDTLLEFRAFVSRRQLTAITQYYTLCYVPVIARNTELIRRRIEEVFAAVRDAVPLDSYALDFGFSATLEHCWIIELNHFPPTASTCLFDWACPEDQRLIREGPLQFRTVTADAFLAASPLSQIQPEMKGALDAQRTTATPPTSSSQQHK